MQIDVPDLFGVLCIASSAKVAIQGASVAHNIVSALVASDNAEAAITGNSTFLNNTDSGKGGGGIYASGNAVVRVQDALARNNSNGGEEFGGGFIRAVGNASIELVNCTIQGNFGGGAGAFIRDNARVSVRGGSLTDNVSPEGYAGGVFYLLGGGTLSIQGPCLLQGNQGDYGAAIYADGNSRVYIGHDVAFKQNWANLHAAVYIEASVVAQLYGSNISFLDNHAELNGGAIYADSDSIVNITGSSLSFSGNEALASGGAIFMSDYAQLLMEQQLPVFVNNSAVVGDVLYAGPNNKVVVSNSSFLSDPDVSWLRKQCLLGEVLMDKGICVKCAPDSYSFNTTAHRCDLCPEHAKCGGGSHVAPVAGYWHSMPQSVQLHACPNAAACKAGGTCAGGYGGRVCGSCAEGYGLREPFQCSACHGFGRSVGLYVAGWVVMLALVVYTWHNTARDNQQTTRGVRPSDILKVLIPFCQYLAILSCLNVSWPRSIVAVLSGLSLLFGMGHVAFVDCMASHGPALTGLPLAVQRLLLSLFTPFAVLAAAVLLHLLDWLVQRYMLRRLRATFQAFFWNRLVVIVLTVLFMFYPNLVRAATSSFACFHLDVAGEGPYPQYSTATAKHGYFVFDLQQECYQGYHLVLVLALAIPAALVFCVFVPVGIWAGLSCNKSSLSQLKVRRQFGSLYHAYKQQHYYWESIVCVQTVILVCIAVFSSELGVFYSALLLNAAFVASLLLQVAFRPYAYRIVHQLQMQASACLYLVTLLALTLLSLDRKSPPTYRDGTDEGSDSLGVFYIAQSKEGSMLQEQQRCDMENILTLGDPPVSNDIDVRSTAAVLAQHSYPVVLALDMHRGYEHFDRPRTVWGPGSRAFVGLTAAGGFAYYWSCRQEVPYTHRHHAIMMVTQQMEQHIGEQTFKEVTQQAAMAHKLLPQHHPAVHLVQRVGTRIAKVASDGAGGGYYSHMQNLQWEFAVIDSPEVNAFVAPGGKVVAYTGLLRLLSNEDELASVLGHEVAHVLARHHAERLSQLNVTGLANILTRALLGINIPGALVVVGMFLPYSRAAEYEADAIGIRLMARACYDPDANVTMLMKLGQQQKGSEAEYMPEFLSTHPLTQERVQRVRNLLPEAYRLHQDNCTMVQDALDRFAMAFIHPSEEVS
eukprot:gene6780-6997_t